MLIRRKRFPSEDSMALYKNAFYYKDIKKFINIKILRSL